MLDILTYPDPQLTKRSEPVTEFGQDLADFIHEMTETMLKTRGIGLAAPQVGRLERVIVVSGGEDVLALVNPEIIWREDKTCSYSEGCLSVPGVYAEVDRSSKIIVKAQTFEGEELKIPAEGLFGVCIQHEIDHLDGKLFIDHLSRMKREMLARKTKKYQKRHSPRRYSQVPTT